MSFRTKGSPTRTTRLATFGQVRGGRYDGWRYAFLRFGRTRRGVLQVYLRVSDPAWPFPQEVALLPRHFRALVPVSGERAPRIETRELVEGALVETPRPWTPPGGSLWDLPNEA